MSLSGRECWEAIVSSLGELLEEMGEEPGEIRHETRLAADLGLSSVDVVHLALMIEDKVARPLRFQDILVTGGEYVADVSAGEIFAFVERSLGLSPGG